MKCPKGHGELRHSSPSTELGIKNKYSALVYVCDTCQGVWVENPQVAALKHEQARPRETGPPGLVECPSCHARVAELVETEGSMKLCSHCLAILKYETLLVRTRTI